MNADFALIYFSENKRMALAFCVARLVVSLKNAIPLQDFYCKLSFCIKQRHD